MEVVDRLKELHNEIKEHKELKLKAFYDAIDLQSLLKNILVYLENLEKPCKLKIELNLSGGYIVETFYCETDEEGNCIEGDVFAGLNDENLKSALIRCVSEIKKYNRK